MSLPNQIIITGATNSEANGTYQKGGTGSAVALPAINFSWGLPSSVWYKLLEDTGGTQIYSIIDFYFDEGGTNEYSWGVFKYFFDGGWGYDNYYYRDVDNVVPFAELPQNPISSLTAFGLTVTAAPEGGGGGSSSAAVKIENANVKFLGKTKFVV